LGSGERSFAGPSRIASTEVQPRHWKTVWSTFRDFVDRTLKKLKNGGFEEKRTSLLHLHILGFGDYGCASGIFPFHRIIEWFELEGTLNITWFQPPCHEQGHLPLDQVAQSSIQPGLERFQGGGSHSFSGQPVPVFHHPPSEEFLPSI